MSPEASMDAALVDWKKGLQRKSGEKARGARAKEKGWTKRVALALTLARWSSPSQLPSTNLFFFCPVTSSALGKEAWEKKKTARASRSIFPLASREMTGKESSFEAVEN